MTLSVKKDLKKSPLWRKFTRGPGAATDWRRRDVPRAPLSSFYFLVLLLVRLASLLATSHETDAAVSRT